MADAPTAVKIVDIQKGLALNSEALHNILLREEIKEKPVCVISIAGAFRQGKSFLLNFFIRYLTITCKEKRDVTEWLIPEDGPISGFSWRGGSNTVTSGILMWSEIFIAKLPTGQEVAVILLDTQGSFDNKTTMDNCASIFALSTLISSIQIYNLKDNIKSSDLDNLQLFLGYGRLLRDAGNRRPFQKLLFLIRDWSTPEEYEYGMVGGSYLLQSVLSTDDPNLKKEMVERRKGIMDLFDDIKCYLLPHPGIKVPRINFKGELDDIDTDFKELVQALAINVCAPQNLVPKVINGEPIKVKDLVRLLENYSRQFVGQNMPKMESIYQATAKVQYLAAFEESEELYDKEMAPFVEEALEERSLLQLHINTKTFVLQFFNDKKMIGDLELKTEGCRKLEDLLDRKFKEYDYLNKIKLEKESMRKIQQMYEEQMSKMNDLEEQIKAERKMNEIIKEMEKQLADLQRKLENERRENEQWKEQNQGSSCQIL